MSLLNDSLINDTLLTHITVPVSYKSNIFFGIYFLFGISETFYFRILLICNLHSEIILLSHLNVMNNFLFKM